MLRGRLGGSGAESLALFRPRLASGGKKKRRKKKLPRCGRSRGDLNIFLRPPLLALLVRWLCHRACSFVADEFAGRTL